MKNIFLISVLSLFLFSCYSDKGNYDYLPLNNFKFDEFLKEDGSKAWENTVFNVRHNENVYLKPILIFSKEVEKELLYEWIINSEVVATDSILDFPVKEIKAYKENGKLTNYIKLKVTSKTSGYVALSQVPITIVPIYYKGFVVLSKKANGDNAISNIEYLWDTDVKNLTIEAEVDIYNKLNPGTPLGNDVVKLSAHFCTGVNAQVSNVVAVKRTAPYSTDITGSNFKKFDNTAKYFLGGVTPTNYEPIDEVYMKESSWIVNSDGSLFVREFSDRTSMQSGTYSNTPFYFEKGYKITKAFEFNDFVNFTLMYDALNKRLLLASKDLRLFNFPTTYRSNKQDVPLPVTFPLFNDLKGEILYCRVTAKYQTPSDGSPLQNFNFVYKSGTGEYKFLQLGISAGINSAWGRPVNIQLFMPETHEMNKALFNSHSQFIQPNKTGDYIFFSGGADNMTLYKYDFETKQTEEYAKFTSEVTALSCDVSEANNIIAAGLKNGEVVIIDIRSNAFSETEKENRILKNFKLELGEIIQIENRAGWGHEL